MYSKLWLKNLFLSASLFSNYNLLRTYQSPLSFLIIHFFNHESPVIPPIIHYLHLWMSSNTHQCPLFSSTNVQFHLPMSTFSSTNVQFYSPMSTFSSTNVQFDFSMSTFSTINIQFHSSLCALSSIKINFSQLIPALFIFKSLTKYNKNSKQKFLLASSSYIFIILWVL